MESGLCRFGLGIHTEHINNIKKVFYIIVIVKMDFVYLLIRGNEWEDIIVFLGHTPNGHNQDVLQRIVSTRKIRLMVISRNNESSITGLPYPVEYYSDLSTEELINILRRASYVITDITNHKDYTHELMSGAIPLAFSTLTPLIMSKATNEYYKFKNVIEFDSTAKEEDIVLKDMDIVALEKERGDLISRNYELFDKIVLGT